jgi:hypothetical protein
MSSKVEIAQEAINELKRLRKKYASFKTNFEALLSSLEEEPTQGQPLGKDCYKVRLAIASKQPGKSGGGGARIITCVKLVGERVFIISAYDKSEASTVEDNEIYRRLKNAGL